MATNTEYPEVLDSKLEKAERALRRKDPLTEVLHDVTVRELLWMVKELQRRRASQL